MPFGLKQSPSVPLPVPCCRHPGPAHRETQPPSPGSYSPSKAPVEPWLDLRSFAESPPPRGNSGIRAGPAIPIEPSPELGDEPKQTQSITSLSSTAALPFPGSGLFPHLRLGMCHAQGHGNSALHKPWHTVGAAQLPAVSWPSITQQHPEPPEKPHQQVKDKPLAFSGLKLSH